MDSLYVISGNLWTYLDEDEANTPNSGLPALSVLFNVHREVVDLAETVKDLRRTKECIGPQTPIQTIGPSNIRSREGFMVNDDAPAASKRSFAVWKLTFVVNALVTYRRKMSLTIYYQYVESKFTTSLPKVLHDATTLI